MVRADGPRWADDGDPAARLPERHPLQFVCAAAASIVERLLWRLARRMDAWRPGGHGTCARGLAALEETNEPLRECWRE